MEIDPCILCGSLALFVTDKGSTRCLDCGCITLAYRPSDRLFDPWDEVPVEEQAEILRPSRQQRCLCCGGFGSHGPHCAELLADWDAMPWGRYKGRKIAALNTGYLEFVFKRRFGDSETRAAIEEELARRSQ